MGGPGTMCIDEISTMPEIKIAPFGADTQAALEKILPSAANIGRPPGYIDMTATNNEHFHLIACSVISANRVCGEGAHSTCLGKKLRPLPYVRAVYSNESIQSTIFCEFTICARESQVASSRDLLTAPRRRVTW